jgi:phytoene desaturase
MTVPTSITATTMQAMLAEVAKFSPEDVQGFQNLMKASEKCFELGFQEMGMIAFDSVAKVVKAMPKLVRMKAWRSIHSMVAQYIKHPKLRIVMSFHPLLIGGNPFSVTCVYSLIHILENRWGVHSAMGGTGAIVKALVNLIQARNIPIRYNAPVTRIRVEDGAAVGVELANGEFIASDIVVSNADAAWTYKNLVEPQHRNRWTDRRIAKGQYSSGLFVWYFGTNCKYERRSTPHDGAGPSLQRAAARHFQESQAGQRLQLVPLPPYSHRPFFGARGLRQLLCFVSGAELKQRHRLARHHRTVP